MPGAPPPPNSNDTTDGSIVLTVVVDSKTGKLQVEGLKKLVDEVGKAVANVPPPPAAVAAGWAVLANQTAEVLLKVSSVVGGFKDLISESTRLAATVQVANTTLGVTSRNMNITTASALAQVQAVKAMNITQREAIGVVAQFERAQLNMAKATDLARAAQDLAVLSGTNSSQALNTLIESIQNQEVITLRQFGIVTQSQIVFDRYAASLNRSAASLTGLEKKQAFLNYILEEGQKVSGAYTSAMEDAGKKVTSLARLTENFQVQMGKGFVPVFGLGVDILSSFLEKLTEIPVIAYQAIGVITATAVIMGTLGTAILTTTKVMALFEAGLASVGVTGAAVSGLLGPWFGIATAIALATTALIAWKAQSDQAGKSASEAALEFLGKEERIVNALKLREEYEKRREEFQRRKEGGTFEFPKIPGATEAQSREAALAVQAQNLAEENKRVKKTFDEIDRSLTTTADSAGEYAINTAKATKAMAGLREESEKNTDVNIKRAEEARKQLVRTQYELAGVKAAPSSMQADLVGRIKQLQDEEKQLQNQIKVEESRVSAAKEKSSGKSLQDITLDAPIAALGQVLSLESQIFALRQRGIEPGTAMKRNLEDQLISTKTFFKEIATGLESQIDRQKKVVASSKENSLAWKAAQAEIFTYGKGLAYIQKSQEEVANIVDNKNVPALQRASKVAAVIGKTLDEAKDSVSAGSRAIGNLITTTSGLLSLQQQAKEQEIQQNAIEVGKSLTVKQYQMAAIQSQIQSYSIRSKALALEESVAKTQAQQLIIQQNLSREQAKSVNSSVQEQFVNRRAQLQLEISDRLKNDAINTAQAEIQAMSKSFSEEESLIKERYAFEEEQIRRIVDVKETADKLILNSQKRQAAEITNVGKRKNEALISLEYQALEDGITAARQNIDDPKALSLTGGSGLSQALDEYKNYLAAKGDLELASMEQNESFRKIASQRGLKSVKDLDEYKIKAHGIELRNQKEYEDLVFRIYRTQEEKDIQRLEFIERIRVATGEVQQYEVDAALRLRRIQIEVNDLIKAGVLLESERTKEVEKRGKISDQQAQFEKLAQASRNKAIADSAPPLASPKAITDATVGQIGAADESEKAIRRLNKAYEAHQITLDFYLESLSKLQGRSSGLASIFDSIGNGALKNINPVQAFRQAMDDVALATGAAFEAFMNGESASAAFNKFIGDTLKGIGKQQAVKAIAELAEGFASLAIQDYPGASEHFTSAAWHTAAAVAAGAAGVAIGGRGGGGGGSSSGSQQGSSSQQNQRNPISTATKLEDNIVRLTEALQKNGRTVVEANAPLVTLSNKFISSMASVQTAANQVSKASSEIAVQASLKNAAPDNAGKDLAAFTASAEARQAATLSAMELSLSNLSEAVRSPDFSQITDQIEKSTSQLGTDVLNSPVPDLSQVTSQIEKSFSRSEDLLGNHSLKFDSVISALQDVNSSISSEPQISFDPVVSAVENLGKTLEPLPFDPVLAALANLSTQLQPLSLDPVVSAVESLSNQFQPQEPVSLDPVLSAITQVNSSIKSIEPVSFDPVVLALDGLGKSLAPPQPVSFDPILGALSNLGDKLEPKTPVSFDPVIAAVSRVESGLSSIPQVSLDPMTQAISNLGIALIASNEKLASNAYTDASALSSRVTDSIASLSDDFVPISAALSDALSQKLQESSQASSENSSSQAALLQQIHRELVKSNEKSNVINVDASVNLDSSGTANLFEQGFVKNTRKYSRELSEAVVSSSGDNSSRQEFGRSLFEGGV